MAEYGDPYAPDVIRALVDKQAVLERRVQDLEGRRMLSLDRGSATSDIDDPVEGQMLVAGTDLNYYAEGAWHSAGGGTPQFDIKVLTDFQTLSTGDGQFVFAIPADLNGKNLTSVAAYVTTVSSSGAPTIQIRNITQTADMLTTKITIDASEFTSYTAATPAVIDTSNDDVATGDLIAIDCDVAGTGAKGLGVILEFS